MAKFSKREIKEFPRKTDNLIKLSPRCTFKWNEVVGFNIDLSKIGSTLDVYLGTGIIEFDFQTKEHRSEYIRKLELIMSSRN